ncbi:MAG TPA: alpha/beta fold hydrolase [Longimicrobium sp.]|nr:alpha/beta fold hydrolase [Longimicrobium sp.]
MAFLISDRWRRRLAILSAAMVLTTGAAAGAMAMDLRGAPDGPRDRRELVVLVHGMGRSRLSMWMLGHRLEREGYRVLSWGYSSRDSVPAIGAALADEVATVAGEAPRVHFVGHSLGNIVVRWTLAHERPERAGRVVMLAPPNQGSAAADRYARYVAWAVPQITELRTVPGSTVRALGPAPAGVEVGVIAGSEDGKVSVAETHLAGERDHVVVPAAHSFLMDRADVGRLTTAFLRTGRFGG